MAATHRVLYDFDATGKEMLTVRKGDQVTLLNRMDESGWCNVRTSTGSGLVPSNYLQKLSQVCTVSLYMYQLVRMQVCGLVHCVVCTCRVQIR